MAKRYMLGERAVRKLGILFGGDVGAADKTTVNSVALDPVDYYEPFRVQYAAGLSSWVIYLPQDSAVDLGDSTNAAFRTMRNGLTAASGYPSNWYVCPVQGTADTWVTIYYCVVTSGGTTTASLASTASGKAVPVADIKENTDGNGNIKTCEVKQYQVGEMTLGGGGGASGGYTGSVDVVTSVAYDTYTHDLTYNLSTLTFADGLCTGFDADTTTGVLVFHAVQHINHD